MLARNDIPVNLNDKLDPFVKKVEAAIKRLKELANNDIKIVYTDMHITSDSSDRRKKEYAEVVNLPLSHRVFTDGVDETITYYTDKKVLNNNIKYHPRKLPFNGKSNFNSANADISLLYFLVFVSPHCETIEFFNKPGDPKQNDQVAAKHFKVSMPAFEATKKSEQRKLESQVRYIIYNEMSFDELKVVAPAMNIPNADKLTDSQLRNALCDVAVVSEANMLMFMENRKVTPETQEKAFIQRAKDNRVIGMFRPGGNARWAFMNHDGTMIKDSTIVTIIAGEDPDDKLVKYLGSDDGKEIYEVIKSKLPN